VSRVSAQSAAGGMYPSPCVALAPFELAKIKSYIIRQNTVCSETQILLVWVFNVVCMRILMISMDALKKLDSKA
jgi:hypothetical protein